ncbi:metallophosphoesterase [Acidiphilium sp. AL]|uniref:metallophosphoesterase n=1 Tax=Acidiphilium sp. AL TaxID=2871704 RepID=UPI0021CB36F2|nr:metallophosphoesterase [Acidiphilium sp. AL]MCU4162345.1 metallophosphoesterase [Acidiphilium sp. AL]
MIAQLTDLHICATGRLAARVVETNMLAERAFRTLAALRPVPDLLVISGDLTENGLEEEYRNFVQLIERYARMPVYLIPGNHDRRAEFRKIIGHLPGVCDHPDFIQYAVEDFPVRLVMLDTVVPGHAYGAMDGGRMGFLDRTLAAAPNRSTMIVLHHPPFRCGSNSMDILNRYLLNPAGGRSAVMLR